MASGRRTHTSTTLSHSGRMKKLLNHRHIIHARADVYREMTTARGGRPR